MYCFYLVLLLNNNFYFLFLLLSCGSGQQAASSGSPGTAVSNSLIELGRSAENVFYSFMTLISDTLGFTAKSTTKKEDVGKYFTALGKKLGEASEELEQVAVKSTADVDKNDASKNSIRVAIDAAKTILITLKGYLDSLKGTGDANKVGEAATNAAGTAAADAELKAFFKALKGIVDTATTEGVAKPKAGDIAVKVGNGTDNKDGAKILGTDLAATAGDSSKAAILSTVSDEEMLASIVASKEGDAALVANATAQTSAISFAKGGNAAHLAGADAQGGQGEVQAVGVAAVNKLLVAVEDIVKKTVKNVLKTAKEKIDKARAPKSAGQQIR
ncbi:variable large family protein [Borrelia turicatae]|uniref:Variable large protein n=1 Tax=Borrelia turicatae (strain 91E135) TaxID=314724 RepID=A0ABF7QZR7_BORT9|nr:variable large family protein [Borrelia turicatae]ASJ27664.1 VlpA3 [Borrelia turicatae 91E135]UPA14188.1 variable large family protein [Borrelia turicatae 91E135]